jgi:hypothetical protein
MQVTTVSVDGVARQAEAPAAEPAKAKTEQREREEA